MRHRFTAKLRVYVLRIKACFGGTKRHFPKAKVLGSLNKHFTLPTIRLAPDLSVSLSQRADVPVHNEDGSSIGLLQFGLFRQHQDSECGEFYSPCQSG
jgi:hypothetical protein